MSPIFNDAFKRLKLNAKTPIWVFTGTGIAVIGLIAGAYFYKIDGDKTSRRVHSPQKDDIFEIRTKNGSYTLYKVIKAEHDSVYFFANKYEISDAANLNQLYDKGDNGFETSTSYGIPISRLIKMDNDGDVFGFKSK